MESVIGLKRKFSFDQNNYIIKEILDIPNECMSWTWASSVCPHCKKEIELTTNHQFIKIEILENEIDPNDFVVMGLTSDNKYMMVPETVPVFTNILNKSVKYKNKVPTKQTKIVNGAIKEK